MGVCGHLVCMCASVCTCVSVHDLCVYEHVCLYVCLIHVCIYACVCVCVSVCTILQCLPFLQPASPEPLPRGAGPVPYTRLLPPSHAMVLGDASFGEPPGSVHSTHTPDPASGPGCASEAGVGLCRASLGGCPAVSVARAGKALVSETLLRPQHIVERKINDARLKTTHPVGSSGKVELSVHICIGSLCALETNYN